MLPTFTAFAGTRKLAAGDARAVIEAIRGYSDNAPVLIFDDSSGSQLDFDLRGSVEDAIARVEIAFRPAEHEPPEAATAPRKRGRPKLGVVAREVTLLPRHWEWLATQTGGASAALRRLVDAARKHPSAQDRARVAQNAAYTFMNAIAGDLAGFEEAVRALFAGDRERFTQKIGSWPVDVRDHAVMLAAAAFDNAAA